MISVLMPVYQQAGFVRRAIHSLLAQTTRDWELILVDDGSTDNLFETIMGFLHDPRLHFHRLERNRGLGAALNYALERARGNRIAYLPADDLYHAHHLATLAACLDQSPQATAVVAGMRHHYNRSTLPGGEGYRQEPAPLQLVQVMHRRQPERWLERSELVTDDLERMYWSKLRPYGEFAAVNEITCEWVDHPRQRHKILREPEGGINLYRQYYRVQEPLRFHTTVGNAIDEVEQYRQFRERPASPVAVDGLKILLVGELAYNADRLLALEERGHRLYGLWMDQPYWYNTVGPLPFGHVQDLEYGSWRQAVRRIKPDLIYALLNWQAVPFAHKILCENPGIPFVWHFKEGPFISLEKGHWDLLADLTYRSSGQIYSSPEMRDWFETALPGSVSGGRPFVLDGDLPKADWFEGRYSKRLSARDGEIHTVVPGRPIGLHPHNVAELAAQGIHLHFYGDFTHGQWRAWIEKTRTLAPRHIHLHAHVYQREWVKEFSQYDAGWLHFFASENHGELARANWDDLNYPARLTTLAAAGLPVLQRDNTGHIVATQALAEQLGIGLHFTGMNDLGALLNNSKKLAQARNAMRRERRIFTFDAHADSLLAYFRRIING
jgi:glycosyltransferase involved in cell wall biosynthesis